MNKLSKKSFVLGLTTGVVVAGVSLVFANTQIQAILNNKIKITLDGQVQEFRDETTNEVQYPITYHNRTYLPLRNVAQLAGLKVDYDVNTNTAMLTFNKSSKDSISHYQKLMETRGSDYNPYNKPKDVLLNAKILKVGNEIVLKADVANPYFFTIDEIRNIVENFENSDKKETKLGIYSIHKEYIEGFYTWFVNDYSSGEHFVDESFDKNKWYDKEKIPYYITEAYTGFVKLKNIDGLYYPFWSSFNTGDVALIDNINEDAFELTLNEDYKIVFCDRSGFAEETYTVKELLSSDNIIGNDMYIGESYFNYDSFSIEDNVIYIYTSHGDGM